MSRYAVAALAAVTLLVVSQSCGSATYEVLVDCAPNTIDTLGQSCELTVDATDGQGKIGAGTVTLQTSAGAVAAGNLALDAYGKASTTFTCVAATDDRCRPGGTARVVAEWVVNGQTVVGERRVRLSALDAGSDGGADTDAGATVSNDVAFLGMLGTAGTGFAKVNTPSVVQVGFPLIGEKVPVTSFINRSGQVVTSWANEPPRIHIPDPFDMAGSGSAYPANWASNDIEIPTPNCPGATRILEYGVGEYAYACGLDPTSQTWHTGSTSLSGPPTNLPSGVRLFGYDKTALVAPATGSARLIKPDGAIINVTLPNAQGWFAVRAHANGTFWIVQTAKLLRINASGTVTELASYKSDPTTFIDDRMNYYYFLREVTSDLVQRVSPGSSPITTTAYDDASAGVNFDTYPPTTSGLVIPDVGNGQLLTRR